MYDITDISDKLNKKITQIELLLRIMWGGSFFSFAIYLFIGIKIAAERSNSKPEISGTITLIFAGIALLSLIAAFIFKRITLSPSVIAKIIDGKFPLIMPRPRVLTPANNENLPEKEQSLAKYLASIFPIQLMLWGMIQTVSIMGLVTSIITANTVPVITFTSIAAVALIFTFPQIRKLISAGIEENRTGSYR